MENTYNQPEQNLSSVGQIQIADEVIAIIAGTAALEVEGVVGTTGGNLLSPSDFAGMLGKKNLSKGVKVVVLEREVQVELAILVRFGCKMKTVAQNVQLRVKNAVETMTGLAVSKVDVNIAGVQMEKERNPKEDA